MVRVDLDPVTSRHAVAAHGRAGHAADGRARRRRRHRPLHGALHELPGDVNRRSRTHAPQLSHCSWHVFSPCILCMPEIVDTAGRSFTCTRMHVVSTVYIFMVLYTCCLQQGSEEFTPVVCNRNVLRTLSSTDVIICKWPKPLRWQFFKKILPDVSITKCDSCQKVVCFKVYRNIYDCCRTCVVCDG